MSVQLKALVKLRLLLIARNFPILIFGFAFPLFMVLCASIITTSVESSFPKVKEEDNVTIPFIAAGNRELGGINPFELGYILESGGVGEQVFNNILQPGLQFAYASQGSSVQLEKIENLDKVVQRAIEYYQSNGQGSLMRGGYRFNASITQSPNSDGKIDVASTLWVESSQPSDLFPLLQNTLATAVTNATSSDIFVPPTLVSFSPFISQDLLDIGAMIVPPFTTYGVSFFLTVWVENCVRELEEGFAQMLISMGASAFTYYMSFFITDGIVAVVCGLIAMAVLRAFSLAFFVQTNFLAFLLPFLTYPVALMPYSYLLSFLFKPGTKVAAVSSVVGIANAVIVFIPYFIISFAFNNQLPREALFAVTVISPQFGLYRLLTNIALAKTAGRPYTLADVFDFNKDILPMCLLFLLLGVFYFYLVMAVFKTRWTGKSTGSVFGNLFGNKNGQTTPTNEPVGESDDKGDRQVMEQIKQLQSMSIEQRTQEYALAIHGLSKEYPGVKKGAAIQVLEDLWFGVKKNEVFALLGPNGAGKSTCMKILMGVEKATSGQAYINGLTMFPYDPKIRNLVGWCPQFDVLWPKITPKEHLIFYGGLRGLVGEELQKQVNDAIKGVGLDEFGDVKSKDLSGGNKRKCSIAIASMGKPSILFLDEPSTGVDVAIRRHIWDYVKDLKKTSSIVLTSHSMEEVEHLSDTIAILINGKNRCLGSASRLKTTYGSGYKIQVKTKDSQSADALGSHIVEKLGRSMSEYTCTLSRSIGCTAIFELSKNGSPTSGYMSEAQENEQKENVQTVSMVLSKCFDTLESARQEYKIIDFSISQTTLAQVFISMAAEQDSR